MNQTIKGIVLEFPLKERQIWKKGIILGWDVRQEFPKEAHLHLAQAKFFVWDSGGFGVRWFKTLFAIMDRWFDLWID